MTQKKNLLTVLFALALSAAFMGCSDDEQPAFEYKSQGYVKGTLTGTSKDGSYVFNEKFNYTQYSLALGETASTYTLNAGGSYSITIARADYNGSGSAHIDFLLSNASDKSPEDIDYYFYLVKEDKDKFIQFDMSDDADNTVTIPEADFSFDPTTGRVKGKYTISGADNSTDKNATITGEFDVIAKKIVQ